MIIDTHGHVQDAGYPAGCRDSTDAGEMIDTMDRFGISQIWVSDTVSFVRDFPARNRRLRELFTRPHPDRFRGCGVFGPYLPKEFREDIKRCFEEYGFSAIKVHSWLQGYLLHQPIVYELIEASIRYHVPVMFHDGTPPYADTLQIAALAERYPEARILLGHAGLFDSYRAAITAANTHDNVWLIISASTVGDAREIVERTRKDRLLFGTDFVAVKGAIGDTVIRDRLRCVELACPDEKTRRLILSENAGLLLGEAVT